MKNAIIKELNNKGYNAELFTSIKNGIETEGIRIKNESNVAPVIYLDRISDLSLADAVKKVIDIYENNFDPAFDVNDITSKEYILSHVAIAIQKTSSEPLVKRDTEYNGIESYLLVFGNDFSYKITDQLVKTYDFDLEELWELAERNTRANVKIDTFCGMPVISNNTKVKGAAAILFKDIIKTWANDNNFTKVVVIPSSIHECLLIGSNSEMDMDYINAMVQDVNENEVDPQEQLSDTAFALEF